MMQIICFVNLIQCIHVVFPPFLLYLRWFIENFKNPLSVRFTINKSNISILISPSILKPNQINNRVIEKLKSNYNMLKELQLYNLNLLLGHDVAWMQ